MHGRPSRPTRRPSARRLALLILLASLPGATPLRAQPGAPADPAARVEALHAEGSALYRERKFRAAIERFRQAHALYADPNLLYNIARSHEALGELGPAITAYRQCVNDPRADAALRQKARDRQLALEEAQARVQRTPAEPTARVAIVDEAAPRHSRVLSISRWVVAGAGLALLAGGAAAFGLGTADHNQISSPEVNGSGVGRLTRREALDLRDSGQMKKNVGLAIGAVGVGALIGSATLFVVEWRRRARPEKSGGAPQRSWFSGPDVGLLNAGRTGAAGATVGLRGRF